MRDVWIRLTILAGAGLMLIGAVAWFDASEDAPRPLYPFREVRR